jgi:hypothetical protein
VSFIVRSYIIFLAFLFGATITALSQKNLRVGIGVLEIQYEKSATLLFFKDTLQSKPEKSVAVVQNASGDFVVKNEKEVGKWFSPEALWLDYSLFFIRVDTVIGKWYRVFSNNSSGSMLWTKAHSSKQFIPWKKFLLEYTTAINKDEDYNLEVKTGPSDKAATIKLMEIADCFEALEISGDWMRIKTNETLECNESKKKIRSCWIRWRKNNRLTIQYGLTC